MAKRRAVPALRVYPPTPWPEVQARAVALVSAFSDPGLAESYRAMFDEAAGDVNEARATVEVLVVFAQRLVAELAALSDVPPASVRLRLADPFDFITESQERT